MSTTNKDIAIFKLSIRFQNRLFLQKGLAHRFQTNLWIRSFSLILYRRDLALLQYRRQPRGELRGEAEQDDFEGHDDGEWHGAKGQKDEVDADEDNPAADLCVRDERHQGLRCLQGCQDEAEQHGADHDGENHRGRLDRVLQDFAHIAELYRAINKERDNQAVERADGSGFGRREEAGVDTADDDNRQQQAPDIFLERCHALLPAGCRLALHVAAAENEVEDEEERHENARYNPRNEELADRLTRDGTVKNHRDARRNQDAERAARGDGA